MQFGNVGATAERQLNTPASPSEAAASGDYVTRGQRAVIGWSAAFALGCAIWAVIATLALAQMPPRAFRGPVRVTVQFTNAQNVENLCEMISEGRLSSVEACANEQVMVLPDPCDYPGRYAEVVCHEIAHTHGWVHRERVG